MARSKSGSPFDRERRSLLAGGTSGLLLIAGPGLAQARERAAGEEVSATEDMMREHGVLRRALLVYAETAPRLRTEPAKVDVKALHAAADLFRAFGEDYHERKLEEAHVFPAVRQAGGPAAALIDVLIAQHERGRAITSYMMDRLAAGRIATADAEPLAHAMDSMVLMYQNHTAREDTIVFPAWKAALSGRHYQEMGEKFEELEHQLFGADGFEQAAGEIARIEQALGLSDLARFTAPVPPAAA